MKKGVDIPHNVWYIIIRTREHTKTKEDDKMTKAEKKAIESRTKDLIKAGVDKELAKVIAKAEFDSLLIKPVVNYN